MGRSWYPSHAGDCEGEGIVMKGLDFDGVIQSYPPWDSPYGSGFTHGKASKKLMELNSVLEDGYNIGMTRAGPPKKEKPRPKTGG